MADFNEQDETLLDVVSPYLDGVFDDAKTKAFCDEVMNILHGKVRTNDHVLGIASNTDRDHPPPRRKNKKALQN